MEQGFLQSGNMMIWSQRQHKVSLLPGEGDILLAKNPFKGASIAAHICRKCQRMVVEYTPLSR